MVSIRALSPVLLTATLVAVPSLFAQQGAAAPTAGTSEAAATTPAKPAEAGAPSAPGAAAAATATEPAAPTTRPRIEAASTSHDAGRVRRGKKIEVDFEIRNRGDAQLKIKDVRPECGCTVASFDKTIEPGAVGKVHAVLDTQNFDGPIAKRISVLSNDPDAPRLVLTIQAEVQAILRAQPGYVRMLHVESEPSAPTGVNLWATDGREIEILAIETPEKYVEASFREATAAERVAGVEARQWRIEIRLTDKAPFGPLAGTIRVRTNHPDEPTLELALGGNVRRLIHAQPGTVDFGRVRLPLKEPRRFVFKLHNFGTPPVEVTSITTDLPHVSASFSAEQEGRRWRVELLLAPEVPKGKLEGTLVIATSSPVAPRVELPIRARVEAP